MHIRIDLLPKFVYTTLNRQQRWNSWTYRFKVSIFKKKRIPDSTMLNIKLVCVIRGFKDKNEYESPFQDYL